MRVAKTITAILFCGGLAACSSGGGEAPSAPYDPDRARLMIEATRLSDLLDDIRDEHVRMPTTGTATYKGFAYMNMPDFPDGYADVRMTVSFANSSLSGRIDNFSISSDRKIDGYIDISQAQISGRDFDADLTGKLNGTGIMGDLNGRFYGKNARLIDGRFQTSGGENSVDGIFTVEK